jgi:p-hydroxybenzoate 3-monooxygenase
MRHAGLFLSFGGERHHVDMAELTGGRAITIYGQNEVVKDLIDARIATGRPLAFEVADVEIGGIETTRPSIHYRQAGRAETLACDFVAGCDGFHGVSRASLPAGAVRVYERTYPFGWLGILAEAAPSCAELVYARHDRGFALFSMRSPAITRLYLQCAPDEDLADWSDDRIWSELAARFACRDGWTPAAGPILQKGVTPMRSFVVDPMAHGRLYLAGDAAHIVPPTGAKGLNLAVADVWRLADALARFYRDGSTTELDTYSERGLRRAWRAQRFSWWMTSALHKAETENPFDALRQHAELDYLVSSRAALTSFAESYVGAPLS